MARVWLKEEGTRIRAANRGITHKTRPTGTWKLGKYRNHLCLVFTLLTGLYTGNNLLRTPPTSAQFQQLSNTFPQESGARNPPLAFCLCCPSFQLCSLPFLVVVACGPLWPFGMLQAGWRRRCSAGWPHCGQYSRHIHRLHTKQNI